MPRIQQDIGKSYNLITKAALGSMIVETKFTVSSRSLVVNPREKKKSYN